MPHGSSITHPGQTILRRDDAYFDAATTIGHPGNVLEVSPTELVYGVSGGYFQSSFGYNYPLAHEEGIGQKERPVFRLLAASPEIQNLYATALESVGKRADSGGVLGGNQQSEKR